MFRLRYLSSNRFFGALLPCVALTLVGCGLGVSAPNSSPVSFGDDVVPITGSLYGGNQPITHSHVYLYASGTTGYGAGATLLATYYNSADTNGSFSFSKQASGTYPNTGTSWTCPGSGDPIIYLLAVGGDPNSGTTPATQNPVVVQAAAIGPCSQVNSSTFVQMNEISTAAFAIAFAPYLSPSSTIGGEGLGTSSTTQGALGLLNAWNILSKNLLYVAVGYSFPSQTYSGTGTAAGVTATATPENAKIIAIANILASCINTSNTSSTLTSENQNCQELFTGALPPIRALSTSQTSATYSTAVDTLAAAVYMQLNPGNVGTVNSSYCGSASLNGGTAYTSNIACLWGLKGSHTPFSGDLTTIPTDWTVSINYTFSGTCSNGKAFINGPMTGEFDASGNLWFVNYAGGTTSAANLAELSPYGQPLLCTGAHTSGHGLTIDPTGNVWVGFSGTSPAQVFELPVGGSTLTSWPTIKAPYAMVSDKSGNIFYVTSAASAGVYEILAPGTTTTAYPDVAVVSNYLGNTDSVSTYSATTDTTGRLWFPSATEGIYNVYPGAASSAVAISAYSVASNVVTFTTASAGPYATGAQVNILGLSTGTQFNHQVLTVLASPAPTSTSFAASFTTSDTSGTVTDSGTSTALTPYTSFAMYTSSTSRYGLAITADGATLFAGNATSSNSIGKFTIPANGSTASVTGSSAANNAGNNGTRSITLDGAGNIWIATALPQTGTTTTSPIGPMAAAEIAYPSGGSVALSPTAAVPGTCNSTTCPTNDGYQKPGILTLGYAVRVDPSGNVWYLGTNASAEFSSPPTNGWDGTNIVQIVGAGVPLVTPLSVAAATSKLASKP